MDAHDLYGLPLERFIPERKALAKELRARGERDDAEAVAALRKPSLAAWAVNQLVRTQRRDVSALFKAGDAARRAQEKLLSGRGDGPAHLREALDDERAAVDRLTRAARGLLSTEGHELSPAILDRVGDTLHAAALDPEARDEVKDGCLDHELRHVGLISGGLGGEPPARSGPRKKSGKNAGALRKHEADARRVVERAAQDLHAAEARAAAAAEALTAAKASLAEARRRAREAQTAHRRAQRELESR
jgi:hypothetical protein